MPKTLSPCRKRRDASEKPINPAAPVTSTVIVLRGPVRGRHVHRQACPGKNRRRQRAAPSPPHRLIVKTAIERLETRHDMAQIVILDDSRAGPEAEGAPPLITERDHAPP